MAADRLLVSTSVRLRMVAGALAVCAWCAAAWLPLDAQRAPDRTTTRKTTTVPALLAYPLFFHNQAVRVRGDLNGVEGQTPWYLVSDNRQVMVMPAHNANGAALPAPGSAKLTDIIGPF